MANAAVTTTSWVGTTKDATLGSNYTAGVADEATIDLLVPGTTTQSLENFGSVRSRGTLTDGGVDFIADDTVILDAKTYIYKASPSADGEVDLGVDLETSLDNLHDAINLVVGGAYGASMTVHPTVTALSNTATTLTVAAKDGGTAGDSIVSDVGGGNTGNATWGAGTLAAGSGTGGSVNNLETSEGWPGDLNTSGAMAVISFSRFYHAGTGTVYVDAQAGVRFIVNSPNYGLAASLKLTGDIGTSIEIVRGRTIIDWNGLTGALTRVWVDDFLGSSENLSITGTGTVPELEISRGIVRTNGPAITAYDMVGGSATHEGGAIATLRVAGHFSLESTDAVTKTYLHSGTLTTLETPSDKTLTEIYVSPSGEFLRRDTDTFTLFEIGKLQ